LGWHAAQVSTSADDQGHAGATARIRTGLQERIRARSLDQVGIGVVLDGSRLARACSDWSRVLALAAWSGTVMGDAAGVYDPRDAGDRWWWGRKGTLSHADRDASKARRQGGRRHNPRKGALAHMVPVGRRRRRAGRVQRDPHPAVQAPRRRLGAHCAHLGRAHAVRRSFRAHDVQLPRARTRGADRGHVGWQRARDAAMPLGLTHPADAGAGAFGRRNQVAERILRRRLRAPGRHSMHGRSWFKTGSPPISAGSRI